MASSKLISSAAFLIVLVSGISAIPIDNGVKDYPHVTCGPHSVQVDVNTLKPFNGRVYVKGEAHNKECVRAFRGGDVSYGPPPHGGPNLAEVSYGPPRGPAYGGQTVGIELKFGQCNMRRQRTLYPRGVEYTFTMVISFHPLFLTKVDRAYRVRCFYMEAEKTVNTHLDVSMLTTQQVNEQFPMPQCQYKLKRGGYDGPYVRYAKVGDKVVHVWQCDRGGYVYGILVKNCYVDDGQGNKVELINSKGCAVDAHLVPDLTYDDHLISAYVETHVFKYADKPHLQFTCTIQLCFKNDGGCHGITPPKCGYGSSHHSRLIPPLSRVESGPGIPISPPDGHRIDLPLPHPKPLLGPSGSAFPPQTNLPIPLPGPFPLRPVEPSDVPVFGGPQLPPNALPQPLGPQPLNPAILSPYKDDPLNNGSAKVKRSVGKDRKQPYFIEADVTTQPIVVLPFDELPDSADDDLDLLSTPPLVSTYLYSSLMYFCLAEKHYKILPKAAVTLDGICMTSSGFGILISLFITMFLFSATLTTLIVRRQWRGHETAQKA